MSTPAYYLAEAAHFRELAAKSPDADAALRWLQMALEYEYLSRSPAQDPGEADERPAAGALPNGLSTE
jgi:hypothetical protein